VPHRALREFSSQWIVFTDDDVVLGEGWLQAYCQVIDASPAADYIGGRILPLWDGHRPRWLQDEDLALISGLLVKYDLGIEDRWLTGSDPSPFGASFAVSREP
jgi:Predicted glycosyltransferases